ncbi:MAG: DUF4091 domain-containing protein [Promethearchaeota archaeon]
MIREIEKRFLLKERVLSLKKAVTHLRSRPKNLLRDWMPVSRYYYEILSISFSFSLLAFFGVFLFFPMELMIFGEGNESTLVMNIVLISLLFALILVSLYKRKQALFIMRIADLSAAIHAIVLFTTFILFTSDLLEPWLTQLGWFIRYNGISVGLFLGVNIVKSVSGLSFLISVYNRRGEIFDHARREFLERDLVTITSAMMVGFFGFFIINLVVVKYLGFIFNFLMILMVQIILCFSSSFLIKQDDPKSGKSRYFVLENPMIEESEKILPVPKFFKKINDRLRKIGTKTMHFWSLFIFLSIISGLSILSSILFFFNVSQEINLFIEPGEIPGLEEHVYIHYNLNLSQAITILCFLITFLITPFIVCRPISRNKLEKPGRKNLAYRTKVSLMSFFDGIKFVGFFFVISQLLYFYDYPLFYPEFVVRVLIFSVIGAIVYKIVGVKPALRNFLFITSILFLIGNVLSVYIDAGYNAMNFYSGDFDIINPESLFAYHHGLLQAFVVGFNIGITLCEFILDFTFKYTNGSDSTNRAVLVAFALLMFGCLSIPINYLADFPGGDMRSRTESINFSDLDGSSFQVFFIACVSILIITVFIHFWTEMVIPDWRKRKYRKPAERKRLRMLERRRYNLPDLSYERDYKRVFLIFLTVSSLLTIGAAATSSTIVYCEKYQRPILAYSPNEYFLWLENSTNRVSKNALISPFTSPRSDTIEFKLAKNEYGAYQLVWRPIAGELKSINYIVSDLVRIDDPTSIIGSGNVTLRYAERVLQGEYPDRLVPVSFHDNLESGINHVLWLSIRVPYRSVAGQYEGTLSLNFNQVESINIKIRLIVWNFTIPHQRHLRSNFGGNSAEYPVIDDYAEHRMNDYGHSLSASLNYTTNQWTYDWDAWDNLTAYKLAHGMNAFRIPYTYPGIDLGGRDPDVDDPLKLLRMANFLKGIEHHLNEKNWTRFAYIYFIDEFQLFVPSRYAREEYYNRLALLLQKIKEGAPNIKIMTTTPPTDDLQVIRPYIDIYCPITSDYDKNTWDRLVSEGKEFWFYPCVYPYAPWPNSHFYNRLYECRVLFWQVYTYKIHGFLYWNSRAYYHGRYGQGYNGYGDGWFIYTADDGNVFDSIRWENYLDGAEDYEYLWLLNATLNKLSENPVPTITQQDMSTYRSWLQWISASISGARWDYSDHPFELLEARDQVGKLINDLSSFLNITAIGEAEWFP